ncbi:MAG TPA: hypothetical protein VFP54_08600 [Acidimicrobiales bacterium]|nr:hypothetical protein [Acidimicrobiales bacterium]
MTDRQRSERDALAPPTGAGNPGTGDVEPSPVPADPAAASEVSSAASEEVAGTEPRGDHQDSEARRAASNPATAG